MSNYITAFLPNDVSENVLERIGKHHEIYLEKLDNNNVNCPVKFDNMNYYVLHFDTSALNANDSNEEDGLSNIFDFLGITENMVSGMAEKVEFQNRKTIDNWQKFWEEIFGYISSAAIISHWYTGWIIEEKIIIEKVINQPKTQVPINMECDTLYVMI